MRLAYYMDRICFLQQIPVVYARSSTA